MTTIRFEDDLKARVAAAAEREGRTTHVFILDAIAHAVAEVRWTKVLATGKTVPWEDAKDYLKAQPVEGRSRKPAARKLRPRSEEHGTNRARAEGPERLR